MNDINKLKEEMSTIPDDYIVLIETSAEKVFETTMASVKFLAERSDDGIIVSANRPYSNLINMYNRNDIDTTKMFVLDCITKAQNVDVKVDNAVFVENVSALTDISLHIDERLKATKGKRFIFFDSITTMLIHNKPYVFARFIHNILTKMRLKGVGGLLISLSDNSNREIRAEIAQLCDKVIKLK